MSGFPIPPNSPRLASITEALAECPHPTSNDLTLSFLHTHNPLHRSNEILPGLHQGGTAYNDTVFEPEPSASWVPHDTYHTVITLFEYAKPVADGITEYRYPFPDGPLRPGDTEAVVAAAEFGTRQWLDGKNVLVRCHAGLNRSGLVSAVMLTNVGFTPAQAIYFLRARRGPSTLGNTHFTNWLLNTH